jgi:hypothetical protein
MELDQFVTQDLADEGVWTPVVLYGKPADFDLLILGDDSDVVQQYGRKQLKKLKAVMGKASKSEAVEFDDETVDDLADSNDEAVVVRIAGIRGWKVERKGSKELGREQVQETVLKGRVLTNDKDSFRYLIKNIPEIKEFVLKVARNRTNFLSQPSGN